MTHVVSGAARPTFFAVSLVNTDADDDIDDNLGSEIPRLSEHEERFILLSHIFFVDLAIYVYGQPIFSAPMYMLLLLDVTVCHIPRCMSLRVTCYTF